MRSVFVNSLAFAVVLHAALGAPVQAPAAIAPAAKPAVMKYADAYYQMKSSGKPLVVLIGAPWCPGCRVMKNSTVPQAMEQGLLNDVHYAYINSDEDPVMARKLMSGGTIPQFIMFYQTAEGWQRKQLTGAHNLAQIETFVNGGVTASLAFRKNAPPKLARKDTP
jgi:thiol-disulfide isomerase/thioredoxin